jgi:glucosylglycerate synthase
LAEESVLTDDFIRQLINVGEVDILVGLATDNNAATVGPIMRAIQAGILKTFPRERVVIINADGGSRDGTPELVTGASVDDVRRAYSGQTLRTLHSVSTRYGASPSAETALRTILAAAELLRAKACAVISPDSTNIEPEWIARLLRPVYHENFDLVTPIYRRHKFEGLLMRNLVYPMTRALYGRRIREPYAAEFGFSGRFGSDFLARDIWDQDAGRLGREMELTIGAITGGYRISQSFLGTKDPVERSGVDLVAAMRQTVAVLFSSMDTSFAVWSNNHGSQPVPTTGPEYDLSLEPVRINRKRLKQMFSDGVAELEPVLKSILSEPTLFALQQAATLGEEDFRYPADLWAKTVYEFAASYHKSVISRDHIIQALAPLYRGRIFTFLVENRSGSAQDVENNIENLCCEFERSKPYLIELCNGGK